MQIMTYLLSGIFLLMAIGLLGYSGPKKGGTFLASMTYLISAIVAILSASWIPLAVGFAINWGLRLMGRDPTPKGGFNGTSQQPNNNTERALLGCAMTVIHNMCAGFFPAVQEMYPKADISMEQWKRSVGVPVLLLLENYLARNGCGRIDLVPFVKKLDKRVRTQEACSELKAFSELLYKLEGCDVDTCREGVGMLVLANAGAIPTSDFGDMSPHSTKADCIGYYVFNLVEASISHMNAIVEHIEKTRCEKNP